MNKKDLSKLIEKYLNDESLPQDKLMLEKYLESFQDKDSAWVENKMGDKHLVEEKIYAAIIEDISRENLNLFQKISHSPYFLKIAAAIVIFIFLSLTAFFIFNNLKRHDSENIWTERITKTGEKSLISFNEGTKILLNGGSRLKYPNKFTGNYREVYLEGEGYFEISHDSSKPFIVNTNTLSVTVLGTSFNVKAYQDDYETAVSLVEGKVKVGKKSRNDFKESTILKPNEQFIYSSEKNEEVVQTFDLLEVTGWRENILKVEDEPLYIVFKKLERLFGIQFELADKSISGMKITANFKSDSYLVGIGILEKLTGLKHKFIYENNKIVKTIFY
jgi:transmembrane sensor